MQPGSHGMKSVDQHVGEVQARGLAAEPLGGPDALARHSLGGTPLPGLGAAAGPGPSSASLGGTVSEAAAATAAAVQQAAGAIAGAAKGAAEAATGGGGSSGS